MGRAFEYRKARKMKRWASMAKNFTKVGREIAIAIKEGGPDPEYNSRLRLAIQNGKAVNMPKVNIDNAIKKATSKDAESFDEIRYEGYAAHGVAVIVETATDNTNRTVANIRHIFSKYGGSLGTSGSVEYMFSHKGVFKVNSEGIDVEELELELIDYGLDDVHKEEDGKITLYVAFEEYGSLQKGLEALGIEVQSAELVWIPTHTKDLGDDQVEEVIKILDKLEEDEDVLSVFHNMNEE